MAEKREWGKEKMRLFGLDSFFEKSKTSQLAARLVVSRKVKSSNHDTVATSSLV